MVKISSTLFKSESYYFGDMFLTHMEPSYSQGVVLFLHGYPAEAQKNFDLAEIFALKGYDVYLPHYAGLGLSVGEFGFIKSKEEILELVKYIKGAHPGSFLSVVGHSWGGLLAIQIANQIDEHLFLLAPLTYIPSASFGDSENVNYSNLTNFTHFINAIAPRYSSRYSFKELYSEVDQLRAWAECQMGWINDHPLNVTIIHALGDEVIPIKHSREFLQKISAGSSACRLIELSDEDHALGKDRAALLDLIRKLDVKIIK